MSPQIISLFSCSEQLIDNGAKRNEFFHQVIHLFFKIFHVQWQVPLHQCKRAITYGYIFPRRLIRSKCRAEIISKFTAFDSIPWQFPKFQRMDIVIEYGFLQILFC